MGKASRAKKLIESGTTITVPEIWDNTFDAQQQRALLNILNRTHDQSALTRELKAYLNQFKDALEAKGFVADYLAYLMTHYAPLFRDYGNSRIRLN